MSCIKTTVVGSYPIPAWLAGNTSRVALRDAVMVVLKTQELAGIDLVTDGELNRFDPSHPEGNGMIDYFVRQMTGIDTRFTREDIEQFRSDEGLGYRLAPSGVVRAPVGGGTLNLGADFEFARGLTRQPLKFTCTGPHMLAKVLTDRHYHDCERLAMDIAAVLRAQLAGIRADVIQLDEANISGHPEEASWAAAALNQVFDGIGPASPAQDGETRPEKAVHVCFGNYGGQRIQTGWWANLLPYLNALHADHLVLEFARRGYEELAVLRDLRREIGLGIGVVDIKDNEVETAEAIARRIENAVAVLGPERLRYIHPDCGLWMLPRSVADRKMRALVRGRDLFEGR